MLKMMHFFTTVYILGTYSMSLPSATPSSSLFQRHSLFPILWARASCKWVGSPTLLRKSRFTLSYLIVPSVYSIPLTMPDCDLVCRRRGWWRADAVGAEDPGWEDSVWVGAEDPSSWSEEDRGAGDPGSRSEEDPPDAAGAPLSARSTVGSIGSIRGPARHGPFNFFSEFFNIYDLNYSPIGLKYSPTG